MPVTSVHAEEIHPSLWTYTLTMHSLWLASMHALRDMAFA
jgi:hypothetical protein